MYRNTCTHDLCIAVLKIHEFQGKGGVHARLAVLEGFGVRGEYMHA